MDNPAQDPLPPPEVIDSKKHKRNWTPVILVLIGVALLLNQLGVNMPYWLNSWQMLLILIGLFIGINSGFRDPKWFILILIGGIFLTEDILPGFAFHRFLWPVGIIVVGIFLLVRPRNFKMHKWGHGAGRYEKYWKNKGSNTGFGSGKVFSSENYIETNTFFGGINKTIVTKDFKGGEINVFMGGTEINLSQADIIGTAMLEINQCMGGTKLIVPPHWEIRSELNTIFGSVEDKRQQQAVTNPDKVLVIEGNSIFGGIEIRNY